ncbi:Predicted arabinose efflux permease, MFS family [Dyella sp. OK004]|uniref:MFS transporter n=1 Tax=Dyella sp. OK004 TaxID=1855292 RepID=UPI0008F1E79B|nr:MFS transporter [Dyella sp. OK004]SFS03390.1 Predicted arabinose efflux permease, MFS family [Dyella sp. OK004]
MRVTSEPVSTSREPVTAAIRATRLIFLVSGIGMAAWAPMVPYAKARLGLDDAQLGLILLAFGGGSMVSMPFVGWLSHRFGNRRVIVASGLLLCLALPVLALAPSAAVLTAALLYFGVMLGAVDVAMNAHAVEVERRDGRVLMSGFHGLFSVGGLAGAAGMSALLALGLPLPVSALAVSVLLAALVLYLRNGLLSEVDDAETGHAPFRMPRGVVLLLGLLCFVSFMAEGSMLDWSAVFLRDFRGFEPSSAGIGYACFSIAMALGRLTGDRLIQRLGTVWAVRAGAGLAALGFVLAASVSWPPASLCGFVLIGLGASNIVPVMFSAAGRLPGTSPAISIAAVTTLGYAGLLSGPALIGFISKLSSLPLAMVVVAGLLLMVAASARIVRR